MYRFSQTKVWWRREVKSDYLYVLTKDNQQLQEYLESHLYLTVRGGEGRGGMGGLRGNGVVGGVII